jgi:hypothetical protein
MTMLWQLVATLLVVLLQVALVPPAQAAGPLPATIQHRIIVHGVYSGVEDLLSDPATAALLNEAVQTANDAEGVVVIVLVEDADSIAPGADRRVCTWRRTEAEATLVANNPAVLRRIGLDRRGNAPFRVVYNAARASCGLRLN